MKPPQQVSARIGPLLGSAILLVLGLTVAGVVSEWLARMFFPHWAPRTGALTSFWRHDSLLGWSHVPMSQGSFNSFGFESIVSINSKGFRDVERSYTREPSKYRIVVLGDSMVWGWGVQQDAIFTAMMESHRDDLEVINLGVSGYGTDQELLLLRQEAVRYRPDMIIVLVMDNDFDTNVRKSLFLGYQKPMFEVDDKGDLILTNTPVPEQSMWMRIAGWPVRHSYLLNQSARAYEQFVLHIGPLSPENSISSPVRMTTFPHTSEEALTASLLLQIQKETQKIGSELVLVLTDRLGKQGVEIEKYFKSHGLHVLNLDPFFSKDDFEILHLPDRIHWSARGHQTVTDSVLTYLRNGSLLEKRSGAKKNLAADSNGFTSSHDQDGTLPTKLNAP